MDPKQNKDNPKNRPTGTDVPTPDDEQQRAPMSVNTSEKKDNSQSKGRDFDPSRTGQQDRAGGEGNYQTKGSKQTDR